MAALTFLVQSFLFIVLHQASAKYTSEIQTTNGKIRGVISKLNTGGTIRKYLGIPFANAKRFENPTDPEPWSDVKIVDTPGKICPQPEIFAKLAEMSEDCLNVNVFVPEVGRDSLPVMVWIHGGAYITGYNRLYDGSYISSLGQVIVVVINYRLNLFGFIATSKDGDLNGNYGMMDQIHALKWVQNNIKKFGGNPNNVTIFGESAGSASVSLLIMSPMTKGLFYKAILQSGDASAMWAYQTYSEAFAIAKNLGKISGCNDISTLANCLRKKSIKEINSIVLKSLETGWHFAPIVGGSFIPADSPEDMLTKANIDVKVLIGCNDDEGSVVTNAVKGMGSDRFNITNGYERSQFESELLGGKINLVRGQNKVVSEAILYRYTNWNNANDPYNTRRSLLDMAGDAMFVAPAFKSAKTFVSKSVTTYMYQLQYRMNIYFVFGLYLVTPPSWIGAFHAADLAILFGQPFFVASYTNGSLYTKEANFSRKLITIWSNFAKTGNPNTPEDIGLVWPQYDLEKQQFMALKPNMSVQAKLRNDYVAFWNNFIPAALKSMPTPTLPPQVDSGGSKIVTGFMIIVLLAALAMYLV